MLGYYYCFRVTFSLTTRSLWGAGRVWGEGEHYLVVCPMSMSQSGVGRVLGRGLPDCLPHVHESIRGWEGLVCVCVWGGGVTWLFAPCPWVNQGLVGFGVCKLDGWLGGGLPGCLPHVHESMRGWEGLGRAASSLWVSSSSRSSLWQGGQLQLFGPQVPSQQVHDSTLIPQ